MSASQGEGGIDRLVALPENVPVSMPELPLRQIINTPQQFKAVSEPIRSRILGIIQHRPATARQIADQLGITPGAIGHHLHVLEEAGLAQVVARRVVRGIIASYYTRTARIFDFEFPSDVTGEQLVTLHFASSVRDEVAETLAEKGEAAIYGSAFPHARLSPERLELYRQRLSDLVNDFIAEYPDPDGEVYALFSTLFLAPQYMQGGELSAPGEVFLLEETPSEESL